MRNLFTINKYFKRYKGRLGLGVLFILISDITKVTIPIFLKNTIDNIQENYDYDVIMEYALYIVGAALISGIFRFLIRETIIVVSRKIEFDLRQDFWSHIIKLPFKYFQNNSTGDIMAHATNDIQAVRMYVGPAVMYSIDTIVKFLIVISIMFTINVELTIYTLLPLPILSYLVYKLSTKIHHKFTLIQEKFSELTTKAQESFSGIRVIKSYVRENSEIKDFENLSNDYLERTMDKVKIQAFFIPIIFMITGLSIIIIIYFGGSMVINNKLTLGDISAFVVYLGMLTWPMIAIGWVANIIQQADASMKRINKIKSEEYEIADDENTDFGIKDVSGEIEFKNVNFRYKKAHEHVLKNLNFKIEKGKTVAFVGHTGVGKSTLVNLISRLYNIDEGEILIDGNPINKIPLKTLRERIGFVPQESFLFSDTLKNNILYGLEKKSDEQLKQAASISKIDKDVEDFPKKYETILGERGITLSGGQKQRTSLARALAIDPKILIMDDSFSAVDTNTEEEILTNLKGFMQDRTSIIISHRISTVKNADFIYVLDKGEIVERGTHDELVTHDGIYADIHFKQLLEEELEELG